jgi:hypothetical protein
MVIHMVLLLCQCLLVVFNVGSLGAGTCIHAVSAHTNTPVTSLVTRIAHF